MLRICRMGRWSFWSGFDVYRSIFDEDVRDFLHFHYHWPRALTLDHIITTPFNNVRVDVDFLQTFYRVPIIEWTKGMWPTDRQISQKEAFLLVMCIFNDLCRIGRWSFWSWFDVNRSTFDELCAKTIFTFSFPSDLDLRSLDLKFAACSSCCPGSCRH